MKRLPRETIDLEALDVNHVYHKHTRDANEFERNHTVSYPEHISTDSNIFGGRVPSGPEELMEWVQEYSNRTGYKGKLYGYNVRPRSGNETRNAVLIQVLLFIGACLIMGFLGSLTVP